MFFSEGFNFESREDFTKDHSLEQYYCSAMNIVVSICNYITFHVEHVSRPSFLLRAKPIR